MAKPASGNKKSWPVLLCHSGENGLYSMERSTTDFAIRVGFGRTVSNHISHLRSVHTTWLIFCEIAVLGDEVRRRDNGLATMGAEDKESSRKG